MHAYPDGQVCQGEKQGGYRHLPALAENRDYDDEVGHVENIGTESRFGGRPRIDVADGGHADDRGQRIGPERSLQVAGPEDQQADEDQPGDADAAQHALACQFRGERYDRVQNYQEPEKGEHQKAVIHEHAGLVLGDEITGRKPRQKEFFDIHILQFQRENRACQAGTARVPPFSLVLILARIYVILLIQIIHRGGSIPWIRTLVVVAANIIQTQPSLPG